MKLATPATAATVVVPASVPAPEARVIVTSSVKLVSKLPLASTARTTGCVDITAPEVTPAGSVANASCVGVLANTMPVPLVTTPAVFMRVPDIFKYDTTAPPRDRITVLPAVMLVVSEKYALIV